MISTNQTIDFIGIGSPRSGSTWLSECLRQHPDIDLPRPDLGNEELGFQNNRLQKETDFFVSKKERRGFDNPCPANPDQGLDWYWSLFLAPQPGKIRGEFSPAYLSDKGTPDLIKEVLPNVKLLVTLRNPVDMIYSVYWLSNNSIEFGDRYSFEEAVEQGHLVHRGLYYKHLMNYLRLFPRENMHVIRFEDIKDAPEKVVREMYDFLGVRNDFVPNNLHRKVNAALATKSPAMKQTAGAALGVLNKLGLEQVKNFLINNRLIYRIYTQVNLSQGGYPPINPAFKRKITDYYRSDIEDLERLLNWDLTAWKK